MEKKSYFITNKQMSQLLSLPQSTLYVTISNLDLPDLIRFCKTSKSINSICSDPQFWIYKYISEFNKPYPLNADFEPIVEYLLEKRQDELRKLDNLEKKHLNLIHKYYVDSALNNEKQKVEEAFKQTYIDEKVHQFFELDFFIYDFEDSEDEDEYNKQADEAKEPIVGNIGVILDDIGLTRLAESDFVETVFLMLVDYVKEQQDIYKDLHHVNQLLTDLMGQDWYLNNYKVFETRLPPPPPNLLPFTTEFPNIPPPPPIVRKY